MQFDLTFNAPAARAFFEGKDGFRVRMGDGAVLFVEVKSYREHPDAVGVRPRARGGLEATVEGKRVEELFRALLTLSQPGRPYFLLKREADGWLGLRHYDRDGDPPRHKPSVRIWPLNEGEAEAAAPPASSAPVPDDPALAYAEVVRRAAGVVREWRQARRAGRPPLEVSEAMRVLESFAGLVREVRPSLPMDDALDLNLVRRARDALADFIAAVEQPRMVSATLGDGGESQRA